HIWLGTAPHIEINYGAVPNIQIHVIAPLSFYSENRSKTNYGYGDSEFGIKYRFVNKDSSRFQIGTFPLIEIPTGNPSENIGNGKPQFYIPIWIQYSFGKWTTYGGAGYWINQGSGNRNYTFIGWQAQCQIFKKASIGGEIYYLTPNQIGGNSDLRFRVGSVLDFNEHNHLLISIGRSIVGDTKLLWYLGYQVTV